MNHLPDILTLDRQARTYMLSWLSADIRLGRTVDAAAWREAYGAAADFQTVAAAREVLAS